MVGGWQLVVGSWWLVVRLVAVGGWWRLVVGGPWGLSFKKKMGFVRTALPVEIQR